MSGLFPVLKPSPKPVVRVFNGDGDAERYEMRLPWRPDLRYAFCVTSVELKYARYPRQVIGRQFQKAYYTLLEAA